jgi:ribonuclease Z
MAIQKMVAAFNQQLPRVKIVDWQHARVDHSCLAYALRIDLTFQSAASSLVFSGDTRPTPQVTNLCRPRVDLLIHEATYEDNDLAMAKTKKHSTRSEALAIGNGLAKRTLLTHFSQRYNGVKIETGQDDRTGTLWMTAVDGLRIPLNFVV